MQSIAQRYSVLSLILAMTMDRIILPLAVIVGLAGGAMIGAELASLPSREELIGQLAGAFVSPVQQLANMLSDSIQSFARLVDARATQLEEQTAA